MTILEVAQDFHTLAEGDDGRFDEMADVVLAFQRRHNSVYGRYCKSLDQESVAYLPIEAFKHAPVTCFPPAEAEQVFESSGTGSGARARHYVRDLSIYERAVETHFRLEFGPGPFVIANHLPGYVEQGSRSSLLYMVEHVTRRFGTGAGGSFLGDPEALDRAIHSSRKKGMPLIVFGAAFGLLDYIEAGGTALSSDALVIETGGMKTHRREIGRSELHERLADGFGLERERIRSEYGMCELMSQCYTRGGELFYPPPWVRFEIRDPERPTRRLPDGEAGALALIDLANLYSVSALLTQDRAVARGSGFEVLGRLTGSELRGCNFLVEDLLV